MEVHVSDWVNHEYVNPHAVGELKKSFVTAKPFPYLELRNFFQQEKATAALKALIEQQFLRKEADLFSFAQTADFKDIDDSVLASVRDFFKSERFLQYMHLITGLSFKPDTVDVAATLYTNTDYLLCHDDKLEGRSIAFLWYLSDLSDADGGALGLKDKQLKTVHRVSVRANTLALFEVSDHSFHEVEEVLSDTQRIAIGGWLHGA